MLKRFLFTFVCLLVLAVGVYAQIPTAPAETPTPLVAAPVAMPAPQPATTTVTDTLGHTDVVRMLMVNHRDDLLLKLDDEHNPLCAMRVLMPEGINSVTPIPGNHGLIVVAQNAAAIEQFDGMLKLVDRPVAQVSLEVLFFAAPLSEALTLNDHISGRSKDAEGASVSDYLNGLVKSGKAQLLSAPTVTVLDGSEATFNLLHATAVLPTITIHVDVHRDGTTIALRTELAKGEDAQTFPGGLTRALQTTSGTASVLAGGIPLSAMKDGGAAQGVILVRPTLVK